MTQLPAAFPSNAWMWSFNGYSNCQMIKSFHICESSGLLSNKDKRCFNAEQEMIIIWNGLRARVQRKLTPGWVNKHGSRTWTLAFEKVLVTCVQVYNEKSQHCLYSAGLMTCSWLAVLSNVSWTYTALSRESLKNFAKGCLCSGFQRCLKWTGRFKTAWLPKT